MRLMTLLILFTISLFNNTNADINTSECSHNSHSKVINDIFYGKSINLTYKYCEHQLDNSIFFKGHQSMRVEIDNQVYTYSNDDVTSDGYFGGEMFYSKLGVFGMIEKNTGNDPFTVTYFSIIDNQLVLLAKITFNQRMGNIIGDPYIENKNEKTDAFIQSLLALNKEYILGDHEINYYEGLLFILDDKLDRNMNIKEFNQLSYNLLKYPDLVNFYRQKIFFKDNSLCQYNETTTEMMIFGCQIKHKQLSICYNYFNEGGLIYRYGNKDKIELSLSNEIKDKLTLMDSFVFKKNNWQYEVYTNPKDSGILIKNNGQDISFLKCDKNIVEPLYFPPIW